MDSATAVLMAKIQDLGYERFSMNIWGGNRLYVNLDGHRSFYFDMEDSMNIKSNQKLAESVFWDMRSLRRFLQRNKDRLLKEMVPGQYYVSKEPVPVGNTGCTIQTKTVPMLAVTICGKEYLADDVREFLRSLPEQKENSIGETLAEAGILKKTKDGYTVKDQAAVDQLLDSGVYQVKRRRS